MEGREVRDKGGNGRKEKKGNEVKARERFRK
jgi:hypothetical protein